MAGLVGGGAVSARVIRQGWPLWAVSPAGWVMEPVIGWRIPASEAGEQATLLLPSGEVGEGEDLDDWAFLENRKEANKAAEIRRTGGGRAAYERMIAEHTGEPLKEPEHD